MKDITLLEKIRSQLGAPDVVSVEDRDSQYVHELCWSGDNVAKAIQFAADHGLEYRKGVDRVNVHIPVCDTEPPTLFPKPAKVPTSEWRLLFHHFVPADQKKADILRRLNAPQVLIEQCDRDRNKIVEAIVRVDNLAQTVHISAWGGENLYLLVFGSPSFIIKRRAGDMHSDVKVVPLDQRAIPAGCGHVTRLAKSLFVEELPEGLRSQVNHLLKEIKWLNW